MVIHKRLVCSHNRVKGSHKSRDAPDIQPDTQPFINIRYPAVYGISLTSGGSRGEAQGRAPPPPPPAPPPQPERLVLEEVAEL